MRGGAAFGAYPGRVALRTRPSKDGAHHIMHPVDIVEIVGSLLILVAFGASQLGRLDAHSVPYLVLNIAGSAVLAVIAAAQQSWGFLLLEGTWAIVSAASLAARVIRRADPPASPPTHRA